jgi:hypothetical protein
LTNFAKSALVSIFTFKPPSDAAAPILGTLASVFLAFVSASSFPTAWQPVVKLEFRDPS